MPLKLIPGRKSPNFYIRGTFRGQSIEETTGTADKKVAELLFAKRVAELEHQFVYGKEFSVTFIEAALDYLEYGGGEKRFLKPVVDHFGKCLLRSINQDAIDKAATKLLPNASNATKNRQVFTPVSAILRHGARKGWCVEPNLLRPDVKSKPIRWITPEEAERLIANCPPHLRSLVIFLLYTGARAGEALWLDWSQVDLGMGQAIFLETKNGEPRGVPLHPRVIDDLLKKNCREGPVFLTHLGQPYTRPNADQDDDTSAGSRIGTAFSSACKRAGIANFTPHCCRHTWATWHYQMNRDLTALQKLGGWKSVEMVLRYAHTNVAEHAQSINKLPWEKSGETPKLKVVS